MVTRQEGGCTESLYSRNVTPQGFRRIALRLEGVVESAHHGHPDFRVGGRIFATLGYPDAKWGMVNLAPGPAAGVGRGAPGRVRSRQGEVGRAGEHERTARRGERRGAR